MEWAIVVEVAGVWCSYNVGYLDTSDEPLDRQSALAFSRIKIIVNHRFFVAEVQADVEAIKREVINPTSASLCLYRSQQNRSGVLVAILFDEQF